MSEENKINATNRLRNPVNSRFVSSPNGPEDNRVSINVNKKQLTKIDKCCKSKNLSRSAYLKKLIEASWEQEEQESILDYKFKEFEERIQELIKDNHNMLSQNIVYLMSEDNVVNMLFDKINPPK